MPELRTDWLSGRTVLVAKNRAQRPNDFASSDHGGQSLSAGDPRSSSPSSLPHCPFCPGNESLTPPAVLTQLDEQGDWRLRVIPNKYPALTPEPGAASLGPHAEPALGAHEVVVESSRHVDRLSSLSADELRGVLTAYAERLRHWQADGRFRFGLVFKNQGAPAGASLVHLHSQLVALPSVPAMVQRELERAAREFVAGGHCPYCRLIREEMAQGSRIVCQSDGLVAFCPFASLQPLEVWLLPTTHQPWFEQAAEPAQLARLAPVLHSVVCKLESLLPTASYNMLLRTSPWSQANGAACHWRIEFLPRVTPLAGLELATGVHINPLPPEQAAVRLRNA